MPIVLVREPDVISTKATEHDLLIATRSEYEWNSLWSPYKIAQALLFQAVRRRSFMNRFFPDYKLGEATTSFGSSCRLEEKLIAANIGEKEHPNNTLPAAKLKKKEITLQIDELEQLVKDLLDRKYRYNPLWRPYTIAKRIVEQEFEFEFEVPDFNSKMDLAEMLVGVGISGGASSQNNLLPPTTLLAY